MPGAAALQRIDVESNERVRARCGDLLDVDAALRREHEERFLRASVERQREVVLTLDVRSMLDPDLRDRVAADVHAEDVGSASLGFGCALGELDATSLAATAGKHLCLDDDRGAELFDGGASLGGGRRQPPLRDGDAIAAEELLPLVLVEVQSAGESICVPASPESARADFGRWLMLGEPPGSPMPPPLVRFADKALRAFPEGGRFRGRGAPLSKQPLCEHAAT